MELFLRKITAVLLVFSGSSFFAQVGVNSSDPKATFDIAAKTTNGSKAEGLIAPRLTGDQIKLADIQYNSDQAGAIVYASSGVTTPSAKTANITGPGYYYFDGNMWLKFTVVEYTGSSSIALNGISFQRAALNGDITAATNSNTATVVGLQSKPVSNTVPTAQDLLAFNGSSWMPLPTSSLGIPKQVISVSVPGNQNILGSINTTTLVQFTVENYDPHNSWVNNIFTVPAGMGGTYTLNFQIANAHTASTTTTADFWTMMHVEKSTDGGIGWTRVMTDISVAHYNDVDNGNRLFWTGNLNAGEKLRIKAQYSGDTSNIIFLGNLAITKL